MLRKLERRSAGTAAAPTRHQRDPLRAQHARRHVPAVLINQNRLVVKKIQMTRTTRLK